MCRFYFTCFSFRGRNLTHSAQKIFTGGSFSSPGIDCAVSNFEGTGSGGHGLNVTMAHDNDVLNAIDTRYEHVLRCEGEFFAEGKRIMDAHIGCGDWLVRVCYNLAGWGEGGLHTHTE